MNKGAANIPIVPSMKGGYFKKPNMVAKAGNAGVKEG